MAMGRPILALAIFFTGYNFRRVSTTVKLPDLSAPIQSATAECPSVMRGPGVPTFMVRESLGDTQAERFTRGVELGVQRGGYSRSMLSRWPSCKEYHLVDTWAHMENYDDFANVDQAKQDEIYEGAMELLAQWKEKIRGCRNYTTVCAERYEDEFFDFIYVDARHDYLSVWEDVNNWWPKLRDGGIIAGHDYITQSELGRIGLNWTLNYDGTVDETGTVGKGAVDKFAKSVCRQVTVSYREQSYNTWAIRK